MLSLHICWAHLVLFMSTTNCGVSSLPVSDLGTARSEDAGIPWPLGLLLGSAQARGWERKVLPMEEMAADILAVHSAGLRTSQGHRSDSWFSQFPSSKRKSPTARMGCLQPLVTAWEPRGVPAAWLLKDSHASHSCSHQQSHPQHGPNWAPRPASSPALCCPVCFMSASCRAHLVL